MKRAGIDKAKERLAKAATCLDQAERSNNFKQFQGAWTDFLLAFNAVFSIVEKSAVSTPQGRQWFGSKKKTEIRKDPLLKYLIQARNADEHGIEPVAKATPSSMYIGLGGEAVHIVEMTDRRIKLAPVDGKLPTVIVSPSRPILIPVFDDRFGGSWYQPPAEHLGVPLASADPIVVGRLALRYCESLIAGAEAFAQ